MNSLWRRTVLALPLALAACGGGLYLEFGDDFDDFPPEVSLAASPNPVDAGQTLQVVAAATDPESGIDKVVLYRLDDGGVAVLVAEDFNAPYEWLLTAPTGGRTTLRLFARATDRYGNRGDSAVLTVVVRP
jgi:Bacterial Ig domain